MLKLQLIPIVFDPSLKVNQTHLGKIDTMTTGFGYHHERHLDKVDTNFYKHSSFIREGYATNFFF